MATKKTQSKKTSAKSAKKTKKAAAPAKAKKVEQSVDAIDTKALDRKGLAAHARQTKKELLAIRFNLQAPSLKEYRRKKAELQKYLAQLN